MGGAGVLAGEVRVDDGGYIGVVVEGVYQPDTCIVNDYDRVVALRSDINNDNVTLRIGETWSAVALCSQLINKTMHIPDPQSTRRVCDIQSQASQVLPSPRA